MNEEKFLNILHFYYETAKLKEVERTGWNNWNISRDKRIESVPEHIYGTQQLAIAIFSEFDLNIDIYKVVLMLSLHETEEITIGDITPLSTISEQEKMELGKIAVKNTFSKLNKKDMFIELIEEFNKRETPEAKFAYFCDKMECDMQAKKYSDEERCSFEDVPSNVLNDKRVKEIMSNGEKTFSDIFIEYDEPRYSESEIFSEMIKFLKTYSTK